MADENNTLLHEYIATMRNKTKMKGEPGYLHYRVLCDYVRDAIADATATYIELGLQGELALCELELECVHYAIQQKHMVPSEIDNWIKHALESKIKKLKGETLTIIEEDNVIELFPDAVIGKAA